MAFLYINTVEKKEVWNLNITGPNSVLALWEFVQKVSASTGNRGPFSFQFNDPSCVLLTRKKSVRILPNLQQKMTKPIPKT